MKKPPRYVPRRRSTRSRRIAERSRTPTRRRSPDLPEVARRAMRLRSFLVDFPKPALWQLGRIHEPDLDRFNLKDLTHWCWSSIDNDDSRDLDQIEFAHKESRGTRVFVGVADVDALVPIHSDLDHAAQYNTTSVYTGVLTFPMLPEKLSTNLTSLNEGENRLALVVEMLITGEGHVVESSVYRALVRNHAQLTYDAVGAWLDQAQVEPSEAGQRTLQKIRDNPELQTQLRLQDEAARALRELRHEAGALSLRTTELQPVMDARGHVTDLRERVQNRAGQLIEDLMIAANTVTATFLDHKSYPSLRRVVKTPERWDRIVNLAANLGHRLPDQPEPRALELFLREQQRLRPAHFSDLSLAIVKLLGRGEYVLKRPHEESPGHFGLAVRHYSHSTAPNRRYPDLITQRILKASLAGEPCPYGTNQLERLAEHCTQREDDANKVERFVKKCVAATILMDEIGRKFDAIVSGVSREGTWVRLSHPPVEGKLQGDTRGLDVGHGLRVQLVSVDPERGFIDFEVVR